MRRVTDVILFSIIITATSLASTGCLSVAESLLFGPNGGPSAPAVGENSTDCRTAKAACEEFVVAFCDRVEACGFESFDDCTADLADDFRCENAETVQGDVNQCADDLESFSCASLQQGASQSCNEFGVSIGDEECR